MSGSPMRMVVPTVAFPHSAKPFGASTMIVEPCSNQPISSPFRNGTWQAMACGSVRRGSKTYSRKHNHIDLLAILEPAHLLAFPERHLAGYGMRLRTAGIDDDVEKSQTDAGDQN